jgi:hypothetical protein
MIRYSLDVIDADARKVEAVHMDCLQLLNASHRFARTTCQAAREENYD